MGSDTSYNKVLSQQLVMSSSIHKIKCAQMYGFAEKKNERGFCTAKAPHIFFAKNDSVFTYNTFEHLTKC